MSSLLNLAKRLRKTLDTGASNFRGNVAAIANPQTRNDWIRPIAVPVKTAASAGWNSFSTNAKTMGQGVGAAIRSPFELARLNKEAETTRRLQQTLGNQANRQLKAGNIDRSRQLSQISAGHGEKQAQRFKSFGEDLKQGIRNTAAGTAGVGLQLFGAKGASGRDLAKYAAIAGGIGGGLTKAFGGNFAQGFGEGVGSSLSFRGVNRLTQPTVDRIVGRQLGNTWKKRAAVSAAANAGANVLEDELLTRVRTQKAPTNQERIISAAIGAGIGAAGPTGEAVLGKSKQIADSVKRAYKQATGQYAPSRLNRARAATSQPQVSLENLLKQPRSKNGQYGGWSQAQMMAIRTHPDFKKADLSPKLRKLFNEFDFENQVRRGRWIKKPDGTGYMREQLQPAYGIAAGIEPERDENGNIVGVKVDPAKAMAGVAIMGGLKAVKNGDLKFDGKYSRGDIKTLQNQLDELLDTKSFNVSGKWQADLPARESAKRQIEHFASLGDEEAKKMLDRVSFLEDQISLAQNARANPLSSTKKQTVALKVKGSDSLKSVKNADQILQEIGSTKIGTQGKALNDEELSTLGQYLRENGDNPLRGTVYKPYGGGEDVVFGVIKDRNFKGQTEYLVMNNSGHTKGRFRLHSTPIDPSSVIRKDFFAGQAKEAPQSQISSGKTQPIKAYSNEVQALIDTKPIFDAGEMDVNESKQFIKQWNEAAKLGAFGEGAPLVSGSQIKSGFIPVSKVIEQKSKVPLKKPKLDMSDPKNQQLDHLMNDGTRLLGMGYSKAQVDKIGAAEARKIIEQNIQPFSHPSFQKAVKGKAAKGKAPDIYDVRTDNRPIKDQKGRYEQFRPTDEEVAQTEAMNYLNEIEKNGIKRYFNKVFNPLKNAPKVVQDIMQNWRNENISARVKANEVAQMFTDIPEKDGWKLIQYMQDPTNRNAMELNFDPSKYSTQLNRLRQYYDMTRQQGIDAGLDVRYLENYLNQVWKETPGQIDAKIRAGAGGKPAWTKERMIPSYQEGVKLGLTPRFTHPAQLAAHYRLQLDKALSNQKMVDDLIKTELLLPASDAPMDWKAIDSPFFPKVKVKMGGTEDVVMDYKAHPDIAKAINSIFEIREPGILSYAAKASKGMQEFALSAGIPKTPWNSFTLAHIDKELKAGRLKGSAIASVLSMRDKWSRSYFIKNQQTIEDMAQEGLRNWNNTDYTGLYKNLAEQGNILEKMVNVGRNTFNSWFNEPTFKRFMPILQIEFFKDSYKSAIDSGINPQQARKVAADATRNFYGISDAFSRPGQTEEAMSAALLAPSFREAMINFWGNTLKSVDPRTWKDPAFAANRKYLVGLGVTYALYNAINYATTGRPMWENKPGKETSVEIPLGGGRSFFTPMAFTISTVPRRFIEGAGYLAGGDIAGAAERMSTFGSMPAQTLASTLTNRTFYDGPIYQDDDPALSKLGKLAGYAVEQNVHPWIGEPVAIAQGRKNLVEATPALVEVPLYPSASSDVAHLKGGSTKKFKELFAINPAAAYAYSERMKAEGSMKAAKKEVKDGIKPKEPGFFAKLFGRQPKEATPEMLEAYFGVTEYGLMPQSTAMQRAQKEAERRKIVGKILDDPDVTDDQKMQALGWMSEESVVDKSDIEYYQTAKLTNDIKLGFVKDYLSGIDQKEHYEALTILTQEVNGKSILASGVIDSLYKEGIISKSQRNALKSITFNKRTGELVKKPGSGKAKKANVKGNIAVKLPSIDPVRVSISSGARRQLPSVGISAPPKTQSLLSEGNAGDLVKMSNVRSKPITFDRQRVRVRIPNRA